MTRAEFEGITEWEEILSLCLELEWYDQEQRVICKDSYDELINDYLPEYCRGEDWETVKAELNSIEDSDYYIQDDWGGIFGYKPADDYELTDFISEVHDYMDENELWDEDDEDEDDDDDDGYYEWGGYHDYPDEEPQPQPVVRETNGIAMASLFDLADDVLRVSSERKEESETNALNFFVA